MDHRLTEIFSARLTLLVPHGDGAAGPIVLDHRPVIDRQIFELPCRILDGIAARPHHLTNQPIGFEHGGSGIVDEARLHVLP